MRERVYQDADARHQLEAIIHPLVAQETDRQAQQALASGAPLLVFDVPLLVEAGARWRARVDQIMVVDCDAQTQLARVMQRNGLPREQVEAIIAAQASRCQRLSCADTVVFNGLGVDLTLLDTQLGAWAQRFGL